MNRTPKKPPRAARALLRRLAPPHLGDSALGDYDEMYGWKVEQEGRLRAGLWYWGQTAHALLLSSFWGAVMLRGSFKVTWRNFKRHKAYSVINIAGLSLGIACCILILLWIRDELSWDRFHENADALHLIAQKQHDGHLTPVTPDALAPHLKAEYPEVVNAARYRRFSNLQLKYGENSFSQQPLMADPAFLEMFSFAFVRGRPDTALDARNAIVITEEVARKLFDREDPLGKTILVNNRSNLEVTGVTTDIPNNSTLRFDCILPFQVLTGGRTDDNWRDSATWTYVQLRGDVATAEFTRKIGGLIREHDPSNPAELHLKPLTGLHLRPQDKGGPIIYVYIFSAMALFVLLIACINFINLTTARAANRAREVGLRKVIGARRGGLVKQFFGESLILSFTAVAGAVLLTGLFLPAFNGLSGKALTFGGDVAGRLPVILGIVGIAAVTGVLTGLYPALFLSSFEPVKVLRTSKSGGGSRRSPLLRRALVVLQFSLSIFLMIGTFVIERQLRYIRTLDLGFDKSLVIYSDSTWSAEMTTIKRELLAHPGVESVSFVSQSMGEWESGAREDVKWEGRKADLKITFEVIFCDPDFPAAHGMTMAQGRFFSREFPADERSGFVLNEEAVRQMGFGDRSPLGERLSFLGSFEGRIIGVIRDFHTQPLHDRIQPVIMAYHPGALDNIAIRIGAAGMAGTLEFIQARWRELNPGFSFESTFLDEMLERRYRAEIATGPCCGISPFWGSLSPASDCWAWCRSSRSSAPRRSGSGGCWVLRCPAS